MASDGYGLTERQAEEMGTVLQLEDNNFMLVQPKSVTA